jgi:hypothetical protein
MQRPKSAETPRKDISEFVIGKNRISRTAKILPILPPCDPAYLVGLIHIFTEKRHT